MDEYVITNYGLITQHKEVWRGDAEDVQDALKKSGLPKEESIVYLAKNWDEGPEKGGERRVGVTDLITETQSTVASGTNLPSEKPRRKTRSDKGKPHPTPTTRVRGRGQFFILPEKCPLVFSTRQELNTYLDSLEKEVKVRVGHGRVFTPERRVRFTLRPVKS